MTTLSDGDARTQILTILEEVLRLPVEWSDPSLAYRHRPEWGSLQHVQILTRLQQEFGIGHRPGDVDLLTSPLRILQAVTDQRIEPDQASPSEGEPAIDHGLANTYLAETQITSIDVVGSTLGFRGHDAAALARQHSYAAVARLIIDGHLVEPDDGTYGLLHEGALLARTTAPAWDGTYPGMVSRLAALDFGTTEPANLRPQGWRLLGAAVQLSSRGTTPVRLRDGIPEAICRGLEDPLDDASASLGSLMVLQADHGASAAAVAVRTAISAGASLHHSIIAALATFGGSRHGGAIGDVVRFIEATPDPRELRQAVRDHLAAGTPVPGFGHRVYRTRDPRVEPIRQILIAAEERRRTTWWSQRLHVIRDEHQGLERGGAVANVDFYAGPLLRLLGFDTAQLTTLFAVARIAGWIAHADEQAATRTLIRPRLRYVGEPVKDAQQ